MTNRIWIIGVVMAAVVLAAWVFWDHNTPVQAQQNANKNTADIWSSMIGKKCDVNLLKDARGVRFDNCIITAADANWIRVQRMQRYNYIFPRENITSVMFHPGP